jgi:hypothetical protein
MDVIQLDSIPNEIKLAKREVAMYIYKFIKEKVHLKKDVEVCGASTAKLCSIAEDNLMSASELITGAIIHGVRLFLVRRKKSWVIEPSQMSWVRERITGLVKVYGGKMKDLQPWFQKLEVTGISPGPIVQPSSPTTSGPVISPATPEPVIFPPPPILVIADSMFRLCKPTSLIYPISHSGERSEGIMHTVSILRNIESKSIVLNHGLNHTRHYGKPRPYMEEVFHSLSARFPSIHLYHFQPPLSPSVLCNSLHVFRVSQFCRMMEDVGFTPIPHPQLGRAAYDREGFHYSASGMREVSQFLISALE